MQMLRGFSYYLKTRQGLTSLLLVVTCALVLAFFIGRTFVCPLPKGYYPAFGPAKWIQQRGATSAQAAYFRKSIYIGSSIQQAWIQIAATGNYDLYVNGVLVDERIYPCVRLTGAYDIKTLLSEGTNAIAVYVAAGTFPGPGQIRVRGAYSTPSSPLQEFYSDSSWKVSGTPDGVVGSQHWYSRYLVDTLWTNSNETSADEQFSTLQPLVFDPAVVEERPDAKWIAAPDAIARDVSFAQQLQLPVLRGETWLQVATNGTYDVIVNGQLAATQASVPRANQPEPATSMLGGLQISYGNIKAPALVAPDNGLPGAQTPASVTDHPISRIEEPRLVSPQEQAASLLATRANPIAKEPDFPGITPSTTPSVPTISRLASSRASKSQEHSLATDPAFAYRPPLLVAYNISMWTKAGPNLIVVRVHSAFGPVLLCAAGHTYVTDGVVDKFATDDSWYVSSHGLSVPIGKPTRALVVGDYGAQPWGSLPQVVSSHQSLPGEDLRLYTYWAALTSVIVVIVLLLWLTIPAICAQLRSRDRAQLWTSDAFLHLPVTSLLMFLWLLSFDVRFPSDFCFTPIVAVTAVAVFVASKLWLLADGSEPSPKTLSMNSLKANVALYWTIALVIIVLMGLGIRAYGLLDASFAHDEASMARFSRGILTAGFPHVVNGSFTRWLTTYELITYPLALCSWLMGPSVLAYRLPALIFSTLTIGLVGWLGYRIFDRRIGLVAAMIYAFLPSSVAWARDGFYPSQECFFAVSTYWLFYEAIRDEHRLNHRYLALSAITFLLTYLSWEGSGFILPSLFVTLIVMRWDRLEWARDRALWRLAGVVFTVVVVQLCIRQLLMIPDYLGIAYDLSEVSTPAPVFLERNVFHPFYYVTSFFFAENRTVLSLLALSGVCALRPNRGLRYVWVLLVTLELCYSGFLPNYAPRYYFQAQPLLVLAAVGLYFHIADAVRRAEPVVCPTYVWCVRSCCTWLLLTLVVISSNPYLLKVYRLGADEAAPVFFERVGVAFKANYRDADRYVAQHFRPGDIVITREPHVFAYYAGREADYSSDTLLNSRLFYDGGTQRPHYIDKWYGLPSLRTFQELLDLRARHGRFWLIKSTGCRWEFDFSARSFLSDWGSSVFETNCQEVVLLPGVPSQLELGTTMPNSVKRDDMLMPSRFVDTRGSGPAASAVSR
jgi:4-amino-4-deoxy-L-arabinose transferase-like glycosyltransferase